MGCDIHFYVEVNRGNGWELAPGQLEDCDNCKGTQLDPEEKHCGNCGKSLKHHEEGTGKCWFEPTTVSPVPSPCTYRCREGKDLKQIFYKGRDYDLFGVLSEVRGDGVPGFTKGSCGMPPDPSPELAYYSQSSDWHSHTWYTLTELKRYTWTKEEHYFFATTIVMMQQLDSNSDNVRAVFWYDN
jgi:hypothetical protein